MKAKDVPKRGKAGNIVASKNAYGEHLRAHFKPRDARTPAQLQSRSNMKRTSSAWGSLLTEAQRLAWCADAKNDRRRDSLGRTYTPTGQAHFNGVNIARARLGQDMLLDPPRSTAYVHNPVEALIIAYENGRLTLKLKLSGPPAGDILVLGAAPCSPGCMKCRHPVILGLLPAPKNSLSDITLVYLKKYGNLPPGSRVFIRTRQAAPGPKGPVNDVSAFVPAKGAPATKRKRR
jgi:hypothetical protein